MNLLSLCCQLIKSFEGFRSAPYQNPNDRPTIGWGNTFYENGTAVTLEDAPIDQDRAEQLLEHFVQKYIDRVNSLLAVEVSQDQLIALVSFEYNTGGLKGSTLLIKLNNGDTQGAADEFDKWIHSGGQVNQTLVFRRNKEKALFQE